MTSSVVGSIMLVAVLGLPMVAQGQATKAPLIGVLTTLAYPTRVDAFRSGLRALGYEEGRSIHVVQKGGPAERLEALAAELVRLGVDVIVTDTAPTTRAALRATTKIPIVFMATADPVGAGFVKSLAQPGGTVTGLTEMTAELAGKRLQLLREIRPGLTAVAVLGNPDHAFHRSMVRDADAAARQLGLRLAHVEVRSPAEIERAFAAMRHERADAVLTLPHPLFGAERALVARLALQQRLPMSVTHMDMVEAGGLFAYAPDYTEQARRAATYVDKILRGARPADLPVEQPTKFDLIINARTAKALGLEIPQSLLLRADRIIQ